MTSSLQLIHAFLNYRLFCKTTLFVYPHSWTHLLCVNVPDLSMSYFSIQPHVTFFYWQGTDYRLYKSEPELTTVTEVDESNGEDREYPSDRDHSGNKGTSVLLVPPSLLVVDFGGQEALNCRETNPFSQKRLRTKCYASIRDVLPCGHSPTQDQVSSARLLLHRLICHIKEREEAWPQNGQFSLFKLCKTVLPKCIRPSVIKDITNK